MSCADTGTKPVRRFGVFTGAGRRRDWSDEEKAAIVAESYSGLESVCAVARRHGLSHSQLFTWRRKLQEMALVKPDATATESRFVPAIVEPSAIEKKHRAKRERSRFSGKAIPAVELEIDGVEIAKGCRLENDRGSDRCIEGQCMIRPSGVVRVIVETKLVDFRKGAEGLAALVRETMAADPFGGTINVFRAKRAARIKLDAFCHWALKSGLCFAWSMLPFVIDAMIVI